ncbi:MAG: toll/interleukin-1 receptor domain-containing protein [Bryobacteraceae bacterium]|nr:toll/interleukin-1 receptor domain-containing protein [Bryobacteraceae bacterium]
MASRKKASAAVDAAPVQPKRQTENPLVFISHDSRDADLAEAFGNLLTDASGGILKSFRSSAKTGTAGIEYGVEWYRAIMQKLDDATDVVALLTARSLNRPWILYETGVAKGNCLANKGFSALHQELRWTKRQPAPLHSSKTPRTTKTR